MKNILHIILISLFSLTVISCAKEDEKKEGPVLTEVYPVTTPTDDPSPNYTFSSTKAGTITYGGSCSSGTTSATSGRNTITFTTLSAGTYSDCTIIVTDSDGNASNTLAITSFTVLPDCCSSGSAIITGTVEDNASEALSGVSVIFAKFGTAYSSVTTDDNGTFSKSSLSSGTYTLTYTKSGFVDASLSATLTADNETLEVGIVQLFADTSCASTGTISGTIKDAVSNSGVANVSLSARSGIDTTSGTIVQTTTSDVSGNYSLSRMSTGWYTIQTSKSGYMATTFNVFACGEQSEQNGSISPTLSSGSLRIVLSWKSNVDLDAHLTGPDNASGRFHVYHRQKRFHYDTNTYSSSGSSSDNVTQDTDSVQGREGPETITVSAVRSGTYRYYVHNFDNAGRPNSMRLYKSKASVKVYHSSLSGGLTKFKAPNKPGDLWTVFEFNSNSGVTRIRTVGSESSSANVDSHGSSVTDGIGLMGGAIQGRELSLSAAVTTFAGTGSNGSADGTGTLASFYYPRRVTTDGTNLYVADSVNNLIRKIVIDNGTVTTLAGTGSRCTSNSEDCDHATGTSAGFNSPVGITTDGTNLYVADESNHQIRKIVIDNGTVTTFAGTGSIGSTDNNTGTSASFNIPLGITTDGTNLYVAEYGNHLIRKIVISTGAVTTVAGTGSTCTSNSEDCDHATGTSAGFYRPMSITTDGTNLYVADFGNHQIRKIVIDNGTVTTFAGTGSFGSTDNTTGTSASFNNPRGITTDGTNLYVGDAGNHLIRKIVIDNGTVTTLAGTGSIGSTDNTTGTLASFKFPSGMTTDGTNLYVVDQSNHLIRKIE